MSINKQEVFNKCLDLLNKRIEKYQEELKIIQESRENSEPSTDPDEQGGQGEMMGDTETVAEQLNAARKIKERLAATNIRNTSEHVRPGSIVETDKSYYFVSVALGKIDMEDGSSVYTLSPEAPIYEHLENKKAGDSFVFNGNTFNIKSVR